MTAALFNNQNGPFANVVDGIVYPQVLSSLRAPTAQDIYPPGTRMIDQSVNPFVMYVSLGAGVWHFDAVVPQATEIVPGIAELATQTETNTGTNDLTMVTPLKLKTALASGSYPIVASNLEFDGGLVVSVNAKAASYTALASDYLIPVTTGVAPITITLPAATAVAGQSYVIRDVSGQAAGFPLTINGGGTNLVGGGTSAATKVINVAYAGATVYSTGSVWIYAYVA